MTIPVSSRRMPPYVGNDVTTSFAYNFYISDDSELLIVEEDDVTEVRSTLVLDTDYTVSGVGSESGGNVVLTDPLATGKTLYVIGNTALTQPTDFKNQSSYQGKRHESALDRLEAQIQELSSLALKADDRVSLDYDANGKNIVDIGAAYVDELYINGVLVVPEDMAFSLPDPTGNANEFVVVNASGTAYENKTHDQADVQKASDIQSGQAGATRFVDAVAEMKALTGLVDNAEVRPQGYTAPGDHWLRSRRFDIDSVATDDGGAVIAPNAGPGRFLMDEWILIDVREFGAKGDKTANDTTAIQNAIAYFDNNYTTSGGSRNVGGILWIPPGSYLVDPTVGLRFRDNILVWGSGWGSAEIIASNTSAGNLWWREFSPAPGNQRIQFVKIGNMRLVVRGNNQTAVNLSHCGRSTAEQLYITVQDREDEFNNTPQTIFSGSVGIKFGVADSLPNGYVGGENCRAIGNLVYWMDKGVEINGGHNHKVLLNDISDCGICIDETVTTSDSLLIAHNTIQRWQSGNYGVRHSGRLALIEDNYFENTTVGSLEPVRFQANSRGNKLGHNYYDAVTTYPVSDGGTANRYTQLSNADSRLVDSQDDSCELEVRRASNNLALNNSPATTNLTWESTFINKVNNSSTVGTNINASPLSAFIAPFTGMYHVMISGPFTNNTAGVGTIELRLNASSTLAAGSFSLINGTVEHASTYVVQLARGDSLTVRFSASAGTGLVYVNSTRTSLRITGRPQ